MKEISSMIQSMIVFIEKQILSLRLINETVKSSHDLLTRRWREILLSDIDWARLRTDQSWEVQLRMQTFTNDLKEKVFDDGKEQRRMWKWQEIFWSNFLVFNFCSLSHHFKLHTKSFDQSQGEELWNDFSDTQIKYFDQILAFFCSFLNYNDLLNHRVNRLINLIGFDKN